MPKFQGSVLGMLQEKDLLATGQTIATPEDPLESIFDDIQTDNLVATYHTIASQYQIPQMAQFHAFDVPAQKSIPYPIDEHNVEKGLIKVKRSTTELLNSKLQRGVTDEGALYYEVLNFAAQLAEEVITRTKVARAEVMATGKMTIKENGIDITVDYGVPAANVGLTLDFTDNATKTIPQQLDDIYERASNSGAILNGLVTSRHGLGLLRNNADVQKSIKGVNLLGASISTSEITNWLAEEFGITNVITDDLSYSTPYTMDANGRPVTHPHRYFPNNVFSFFGTANGMKFASSIWGAPPEVRVSNFYESAGPSERSQYVYMTQYIEEDPAILWTKASTLYVPVLYNPNSLYIAKAVE